MYRVAVCDDSPEELAQIAFCILDYAAAHDESLKITCTQFGNALDLLAAIEAGQAFDLIFLDIIMPHITGMDAAAEIRQLDKDVKIVFLTSSSEFAVDSYAVNAYFYALKPVGPAVLVSLLDRVFAEREEQAGAWFLIKSTAGLTRIHFSKLEYAEVLGRTLNYHLTNGVTMASAGAIGMLDKLLLPENGFIKPHRSYIVNMSHIDTLAQRQIVMQSKAIVPIAKANWAMVKTAYMDYSFTNLKHQKGNVGCSLL